MLGTALLSSAGCGDDGSDTEAATPGDTRQLEVPVEEPAKQALTAEPVKGGHQGISYEAYDESITEILYLLDQYWAEALPEGFDTEYVPPNDIIAYYPDEGAPKCGGERLGAENAFYCPANNTIAWDEPGLTIPFYQEVGDAAVGFVIAHEWGHLIQSQLVEKEFPLTIEEELNADCLAGTFAGALFDEGLLEGGPNLEPGTDLAEAAEGIFLFGDAPDIPWHDPQAHGTGEQRQTAFEVGFDGGPQACVDELGPGFTEEL